MDSFDFEKDGEGVEDMRGSEYHDVDRMSFHLGRQSGDSPLYTDDKSNGAWRSKSLSTQTFGNMMSLSDVYGGGGSDATTAKNLGAHSTQNPMNLEAGSIHNPMNHKAARIHSTIRNPLVPGADSSHGSTYGSSHGQESNDYAQDSNDHVQENEYEQENGYDQDGGYSQDKMGDLSDHSSLHSSVHDDSTHNSSHSSTPNNSSHGNMHSARSNAMKMAKFSPPPPPTPKRTSRLDYDDSDDVSYSSYGSESRAARASTSDYHKDMNDSIIDGSPSTTDTEGSNRATVMNHRMPTGPVAPRRKSSLRRVVPQQVNHEGLRRKSSITATSTSYIDGRVEDEARSDLTEEDQI